MYDLDAIEAINIEQLATATDRLLLRGGRLSKRASTNRIITLPARPAHEHTVIVRRKRSLDPAALMLSSAIIAVLAAIATFI